MDPLSGVSSVIAVISLALQLAGAARETKGLICRIRDGPRELERLQNQVDQVFSISEGIRTVFEYWAQVSRTDFPIVLINVLEGLGGCERALASLRLIVEEAKPMATGRRVLTRTWASLGLARRRNDILDVERRLGHAISLLNIAMTTSLM
jgi:hypothetical protein